MARRPPPDYDTRWRVEQADMTDSLKDQLIKAGFRPAPKPKPKAKARPKPRKRARASRQGGPGGSEISLAAAYAAKEKTEQREEARRKAEKMRLDAERKRQNDELQALLKGKTHNDPEAEIPRHFRDGDRITRIYVTPEQQEGLARGSLGIVKLRRRYWLVAEQVARQAGRIKPDAVIDLSTEQAD